MKVIYTAWFSGVKCVGIVVTENEMGKRHAYIGVGDGVNEEEDKKRVAEHGVKVPKESLQLILDKLVKKGG